MKLNEEFGKAREAGEEEEPKLVGAYLQAVRASGREAAARFEARAVLVASNWVPPEVSDVMAFAPPMDAIRTQQRAVQDAITGRLVSIPGVSFDALAPPTQKQLDKLGLRAATLAGDIRQPVGDAIARGWAEGRSVPQTAALITSKVNDLAPARATMLARTDLISLSNGANQASVSTLNEAAVEAGEDPLIQSKTWLATGDGRTRPTHADADGQTVPFDQPYDVGGEELLYPGDPDGSDEEVINCRCTELYSEEPATAADTREVPEEAEVPVALEDRLELPNDLMLAGFGDEFRAVNAALSQMPLTRGAVEKMSVLPEGKLKIETPLSLPGANGHVLAPHNAALDTFAITELKVARASPHFGNTYLHELGHFMDLTSLGSRYFASQDSGHRLVERLRAALRESPEMKGTASGLEKAREAVKTAEAAGETAEKIAQLERYVRMYEYHLKETEQFARAFAQWSASRYGGAKLRAELREMQEIRSYSMPDVWTDEAFAPIAKALDELLQEFAVIPKGATASAGWSLSNVTVWLLPGVEQPEPLRRALPRVPVLLDHDSDDLLVREAVQPSLEYVEHETKDTRLDFRIDYPALARRVISRIQG